jgi:hypothetical protein
VLARRCRLACRLRRHAFMHGKLHRPGRGGVARPPDPEAGAAERSEQGNSRAGDERTNARKLKAGGLDGCRAGRTAGACVVPCPVLLLQIHGSGLCPLSGSGRALGAQRRAEQAAVSSSHDAPATARRRNKRPGRAMPSWPYLLVRTGPLCLCHLIFYRSFILLFATRLCICAGK